MKSYNTHGGPRGKKNRSHHKQGSCMIKNQTGPAALWILITCIWDKRSTDPIGLYTTNRKENLI